MAKIDVMFMKGDRATAKSMGNTYRKKRPTKAKTQKRSKSE